MDAFLESELFTWIVRILMFVFSLLTLKWFLDKFSGNDKVLNKMELKEAVGLILFVWAIVHMILKEGNRPINSEHVYGDTWLFIVFTALVTALHLEKALDKFIVLMEMIVRLRTGGTAIGIKSIGTSKTTAEDGSVTEETIMKEKVIKKQGTDETPS